MAALMLSACDEDFGDWAIPAGNEQAPIHSFGAGSVSGVDLIDFASLDEEQTVIKVANITAPKADSTFATSYKISLGKDEYDITPEGVMSRAPLEDYLVNTFGRRPAERDVHAAIIATVGNGATSTRYVDSLVIKAKPKAPFIDDAYYMVGDMFDWNKDAAVKFQHSDKDVYEDPVFTITFTTTKADSYWQIIPNTNYNGDFWYKGATGVVGTAENGDPSLEGILTTNDPQAGMVEEPGIYRMTINMMDYSYKIEKLNFVEFLYMAGDANGWSHRDILHSPAFDGKYTGYMYLTQNGFKFCEQPNWDGTNYGDNFSTAGDAGNIKMSEPDGFYKVEVNLETLSYTLTAITTIGIIGDATAGGWGSDQAMTYDADNHCWVANGVTLKDGSIKFRANNDWPINWGGEDLNKLAVDGANINVTAGTYNIKLYPSYDGNTRAEIIAQ